jgi:hypothetical protein
MDEKKYKLIMILLKKIQKKLIEDDRIPLDSAKEINKIINDVQLILKNIGEE